MKRCTKCGEMKCLSLFYAHKGMADGHLSKCKECCKAASKSNRDSKLDYYRAYDRERGNRQGVDYTRKYRADNPEKYKAHTLVNNAVRDGKLTRLPCERCSNPDSHAHHEDYNKPLEVIWLCAACHKQHHMEK